MTELHPLKQQLLQEQAVLRKELTELGIQVGDSTGDWIATPEAPADTEADGNIVADRHEEWILRRGEVDSLETRYNNVTRALSKIESGAYGKCEICGVEIEADRLTVNPASRTCKTHLNDESQLAL